MKKIYLLLIISILIVSLTGCGNKIVKITEFERFQSMVKETDKIEVEFDNNTGSPFNFSVTNKTDIDEIMEIIFSSSIEDAGDEPMAGDNTNFTIIQGDKKYRMSFRINKEGSRYYTFTTDELQSKIRELAVKAGAFDTLEFIITYKDPDGALYLDTINTAKAYDEVTIKVCKIIDADVLIYINGKRLTTNPVEYDNYNEYKFVMPRENVTVELEISAIPNTIWLHYVENWLQELKAEDIKEIITEKGAVGVAPGSPTSIKITNDQEEVVRLVKEWKDVTIDIIYDDSWCIDGGGFEYIMFVLNDGTIYSVYSNNGYYNNYDEHYKMSSFPMIKEDKVTKTSEGVVDKLGNMDFIVENISFDYHGALPDALETFYMDENNIYAFPQIQSEFVTVYYENGYKENVKEALRNKRIVITDLDLFSIDYYSSPIYDK